MARGNLGNPTALKRHAMAFGGLIAIVLAFAAFGPKAELPRALDNAPVAESVSLFFADGPNGTVIATNAATGQEITTLGIGEGGFVRQAMRGLARDRMLAVDLGRRALRAYPACRRQAGTFSDPETRP